MTMTYTIAPDLGESITSTEFHVSIKNDVTRTETVLEIARQDLFVILENMYENSIEDPETLSFEDYLKMDDETLTTFLDTM